MSEQLAIRTESLTDNEIKIFFVGESETYVNQLLDGEHYLLEGSRGVGKTMLMRFTELEADKMFHSKRIFTSYISFEDSLKVERLRGSSAEYNPFLQWTMGKILKSILDKIALLKIDKEEKDKKCLIDNLSKIFGMQVNFEQYSNLANLLKEYINILETANYKTSEDIKKYAKDSLGIKVDELFKALNTAVTFKKFLEKFCDDTEINRLVLLFDEAAHTLSEQQQEEFFSFMKGLRSTKISCKAAVYPGISSYGKDFDYGHDAKVLRLDRKPEEGDKYYNFLKSILKKRIGNSEVWTYLNTNNEVFDTLITSCFGNPRHLFFLLEYFEDILKTSNVREVPTAVKNYVEQILWKYYLGLQQRLSRLKIPVESGYNFITGLTIPQLREQNNAWRRKTKPKLTIYIAIENEIFDDLKDMIGVLIYAGILSERGQQSIGQNKYGKAYAINTAICISENVLKRDKNTGNSLYNEIKLLDKQRVKIYYKGTKEITNLISNLKKSTTLICPNCGKDRNTEWKVCPFCTKAYPEEESLYEKLRSHSIDYLPITNRLKIRVKDKYKKIGEILDASDSEVDKIYYIGPVRVKIIKTAAIEYLAG